MYAPTGALRARMCVHCRSALMMTRSSRRSSHSVCPAHRVCICRICRVCVHMGIYRGSRVYTGLALFALNPLEPLELRFKGLRCLNHPLCLWRRSLSGFVHSRACDTSDCFPPCDTIYRPPCNLVFGRGGHQGPGPRCLCHPGAWAVASAVSRGAHVHHRYHL